MNYSKLDNANLSCSSFKFSWKHAIKKKTLVLVGILGKVMQISFFRATFNWFKISQWTWTNILKWIQCSCFHDSSLFLGLFSMWPHFDLSCDKFLQESFEVNEESYEVIPDKPTLLSVSKETRRKVFNRRDILPAWTMKWTTLISSLGGGRTKQNPCPKSWDPWNNFCLRLILGWGNPNVNGNACQ